MPWTHKSRNLLSVGSNVLFLYILSCSFLMIVHSSQGVEYDSTISAEKTHSLSILNDPVVLNRVYAGQARHIEFSLHNESVNDVSVTIIKADCRCTRFTATPPVLAPHSKGIISGTIVFDNDPGLVRKTIYTRANNGEEHILHVEAHVVDNIVAIPRIVDFGKVYWNDIISTKTQIRCKNGSAIPENLTIIEGMISSLQADVASKTPDQLDIKISLKEPSPGSFAQRILLKSDDSEYPEIEIPVHADVFGPLEVRPNHIYLGSRNPGEAISRKIACSIKPGAQTEIKDVRLKASGLKMRYNVTKQENLFYIDMSFELPLSRGLFRDYIVIESINPTYQRFIDVSAYIDLSMK